MVWTIFENLRVQKNLHNLNNFKGDFLNKFLAMHITNQKLSLW